MIRYHLDDLGWFQFEWLVQSLLKAEAGLAIESWGGSRDLGRDAYTTSSLRFPDRRRELSGPFVFQVKFVEGANAAGSRPGPALLSAVQKEAERLTRRLGRFGPDPLSFYTLLTNAPLDARLRLTASDLIRAVLPNAQIHILGGNDICDLLDRHPTLRRSFPQLLGLRDLDDLLASVVNRDILQVSKAAIDEARPLLPIFVPTAAYERAWEVARRHHFVVLEGPPEVGKTAIAWVIAVAQIANGWQAFVCNNADDFFRAYDEKVRQVFVADDAFGRTEYDPNRGRIWERQLPRLLQRIDAGHWFLWTSRKHIFERAMRDVDLEGAAHRFPRPGAVVVDATQLSAHEKALILYRHAKAATLEDSAKSLLREHAVRIVGLREFTPERVRRFVTERLRPLLLEAAQRRMSREDIASEVADAIRNPTERMRKTFRKLPQEHKWILISLLEAGGATELTELEEAYLYRRPNATATSFRDLVDELREAFVTVRHDRVNWIHPSYRDLLIEELAADRGLRRAVWASLSLSGLKVAVSDASGPRGDARYPLLVDRQDWQDLSDACTRIVAGAPPEQSVAVLEVLESATRNAEPPARGELATVVRIVCDAIRADWDQRQTDFTALHLRAFCKASTTADTLPQMPRSDNRWLSFLSQVRDGIRRWEVAEMLDLDVVEEWLQLAEVLRDNEPRLLRQHNFPVGYLSDARRILVVIGQELAGEYEFSIADEYREIASRCRVLRVIVDLLTRLGLAEAEPPLNTLMERASERSEFYEEKAREIEWEEDPDEGYADSSSSDDSISIEELFRDL